MTTKEVTLNLNWLQRQRLQHVLDTMPGLDVTVAPLGDTDSRQWRRDVRVTGGAYPIELALRRARVRVPTDASEPTSGAGLGRGINRGSDLEFWKALSRMGIVLLATAGPAHAEYAGSVASGTHSGTGDDANSNSDHGNTPGQRDCCQPQGWFDFLSSPRSGINYNTTYQTTGGDGQDVGPDAIGARSTGGGSIGVNDAGRISGPI